MTWQHHSMPRGGPKPSPYPGPTGLVWTRPVLTIDRSMLTVDLAPHVSGTDTLDPHVGWWRHTEVTWDPHVGSQHSRGDVMLMSR